MKNKVNKLFTEFTTSISTILGKPLVFVSALFLLSMWALSGPLLGFSDTWQLIINTSTTIITFLTVFIIQNTQNRDNLAINLKLDSVMKKLDIKDAHLLSAEDESDSRLEKDKKKFEKSAKKHKRKK